jgi:hypothetical protein
VGGVEWVEMMRCFYADVRGENLVRGKGKVVIGVECFAAFTDGLRWIEGELVCIDRQMAGR